MRITESTQYRNALSQLEQPQNDMAKYEQQLSTGKKLNAPSDDPLGASRDIGAYADLATVSRYSSAADLATATLSVADSALSDMVNQLTAAKTAAQSAQGTAVTASQRQAAIGTLQGIKASLVSDLGATFQGVHLFSGTNSTSAPYTISGNTVSSYQGNATSASVDVASQLAVNVTLDGQSIAQGSDTADVFTHIDTLITAIQNGDNAGISTEIGALSNAFDRTVQAQTSVGTSLSRLTDQSARLNTMKTTVQSQISGLEDADIAQAITGLQQAQTAQQATLGTLAIVGSQRTLMDYIA
jgi:flagellar hook-associated protein 3 FlgL